jgi:F-type H+-transporting ATPase subunit b
MNWIEIWRWVNFLALAALVVWLVRKIDVGAMLQKRREQIKAELEEAHRLEQEASALKAQAEQELANAGTKAQEILHDARKMGERVQAELRQMAEAEATRIHEQAHLEAELEYQKILKELKREASEEAIRRASEVIKQELTPADQELLVRDFLRSLDKEALTK